MPDKTISQIREAKTKLDRALVELVSNFEKENEGVEVTSINVIRSRQNAGSHLDGIYSAIDIKQFTGR